MNKVKLFLLLSLACCSFLSFHSTDKRVPKSISVSEPTEINCDVTFLRNRKESNPDKRLVSIWLLWKTAKMEVTEYAKSSDSIWDVVIRDIKNNNRINTINKLDELIKRGKGNIQFYKGGYKMRELETLDELLSCFYSNSVSNYSQLKSILSKDEEPHSVANKVVVLSKPINDYEIKTIIKINNELNSLDKNYLLSQIKVQD